MTVFYRKYRPQKFADLVGQEKIKETLLAQLTSGKIGHGYLFAGPRGTGKTSTARIFAKALNCKLYAGGKANKFGEPCNKCVSCLAIADGSHLDLIEIDAASNRGIDEIRDLREKIKLSPVSSKFKVYIIDEAHMLTTEAFNALLKTLEEPPAHAVFILCTTSPAKLPATIISRLGRFNFLRARDEEIVEALLKIVKKEGLQIEEDACSEIARIADGSFRDAVSILDQLAAKGRKIRVSDARAMSGVSGLNVILAFLKSLADSDLKPAILQIEEFSKNDGDISLFIREVVLTVEKLLLIRIDAQELVMANVDNAQGEQLRALAQRFGFGDLQNIMKLLLIAENEIKIYPLPKISLILAVCKICQEPETTYEKPKTGEQGPEPKRSRPVVDEVVQSDHAMEPKHESELTETEIKLIKKPVKSKKGKIKSLSQIEDKWGQFLTKVRPVNAHVLALLRSTRPADISGDILTIEVFYRFHKDKLEEPKITRMLEGFLEEIFNTKIGLKFILSEKKQNLQSAAAQKDLGQISSKDEIPQAVKQSDVVDVSGEDLSTIAAEIFSK